MRRRYIGVVLVVSSACGVTASALGPRHAADTDQEALRISLSELLRVVQFYNAGAFQCYGGTEDGYDVGEGPQDCPPHDSDYAPQDWRIALSELLRLIQLFNSNAYHCCAESDSEDGYCPGMGNGACPGELDTTPPVISLLSPLTVAVPCGEDYVEPGVFALDDNDGDLTEQVQVDLTELEVPGPGLRTVTYTVSDTAGNVTVRTRRVFSLCETPITIADPVLEAAVRAAISKPVGDLLPADLAAPSFTELDAATVSVASLTGIEYAVSLERLDLHGNCIADVQALSHLDGIQRLNLHDNDIVDIAPLRYLENLSLLWLGRNQIEDIQPLADNTGLDGGGGEWDRINLAFNPLNDLAAPLLDIVEARGAYVWRPAIGGEGEKGADIRSARMTLRYDDGEVQLVDLVEFDGASPMPKYINPNEPRVVVRDGMRNEIVAPVRFALASTSCGLDAPDGVSVGDLEETSTAELSVTVPIFASVQEVRYVTTATTAPTVLYPAATKRFEKGNACAPADAAGDPIPISATLIHGDPAIPDEHAFVLLIMGDAFPENELGNPRAPLAASNTHYIPYAEAIGDSIHFMLANEPFAEFAAWMKIYRVDLVSEDNRPTDISAEPNVIRDTALRMERKCVGFNYDQALCGRVASNTGIAWDKIVLLPNGNGSGTQSADFIVYSNFSPSRKMTALHEFGHGIGVLSDEYEYRHGTTPPANYEPADVDAPNAIARNLTVPTFDDIPWRHWLLDTQSDTCMPSSLGDAVDFNCTTTSEASCQCEALPLSELDCVPLVTCEPDGDFVAEDGKLYGRIAWPEPGVFPSVVGLFEGSKYRRKGAYRPELRCRMRSDDDVEPGLQETPLFCRVCRESLIAQMMLRAGNVAHAFPHPDTPILLSAQDVPLAFNVALHGPAAPEHTPIVQGWRIDGNLQPEETNEQFLLNPGTLSAGPHTVSVTTYNPTPWIHPGFVTGQQAITQEITWQVTVE